MVTIRIQSTFGIIKTSMIRSTLTYGFIALYLIVMAPFAMVWTAIRRETRLVYKIGRLCVMIAGWISGVRVSVHGKEKLSDGQNYLFLSNHQGNCDGPALFYVIPRDIRVLIKKEMMRIPILSRVMRQVKFVPIDRSDRARARQGIEKGSALLREGYSFLAFPEGTRSRNGELGSFKRGVFVMALKADTPVLPISIVNSRQIQPPGAYSIRPGTIVVVFHDPLPTTETTVAERDQIARKAREVIASALSS